MTLFHDLDFNLSNLRQFPNAKHRKKIKEILKEGRKAKQDRATAEAGALASDTSSAHASGNVDDKADSICWFCHADVTNLENNKCAGCRKVTQLSLCSLQILRHKTIFQARYCDERCQKADWGRHGDYCVLVQEKIRNKIEKKITTSLLFNIKTSQKLRNCPNSRYSKYSRIVKFG